MRKELKKPNEISYKLLHSVIIVIFLELTLVIDANDYNNLGVSNVTSNVTIAKKPTSGVG